VSSRARSLIPCSLLIGVVACGGVALVRAADTEGPPDPPQIAATDIPIANAAYEQFRQQFSDVECYVAVIEREGEHLTVSFTPRDNVPEQGDSVQLRASKCRQGATYVLNRQGEIIKKAYHR
jgi:hypothetical protein